MDYKKLMGYSNKKKTITKESKKNKIIENIKEEFGYKNTLKEGPSYEYRDTFKDIEKDLQNFSAGVLNFYEWIRKKGLDKEANYLLNNIYKKHIIGFSKEFKKFARKLM